MALPSPDAIWARMLVLARRASVSAARLLGSVSAELAFLGALALRLTPQCRAPPLRQWVLGSPVGYAHGAWLCRGLEQPLLQPTEFRLHAHHHRVARARTRVESVRLGRRYQQWLLGDSLCRAELTLNLRAFIPGIRTTRAGMGTIRSFTHYARDSHTTGSALGQWIARRVSPLPPRSP